MTVPERILTAVIVLLILISVWLIVIATQTGTHPFATP